MPKANDYQWLLKNQQVFCTVYLIIIIFNMLLAFSPFQLLLVVCAVKKTHQNKLPYPKCIDENIFSTTKLDKYTRATNVYTLDRYTGATNVYTNCNIIF